MTTPSPDPDLADALLDPYGLPAQRRRGVKVRALDAAQRMAALADALKLADEPSAYLAELRREAAARAR